MGGRSQIKGFPLNNIKLDKLSFDPTGNHLLLKPVDPEKSLYYWPLKTEIRRLSFEL